MEVVDVALETRTTAVDLSGIFLAQLVPGISISLGNQTKASIFNHPYLQKLDLVDYVQKDQFEIDLIGADYYLSSYTEKDPQQYLSNLATFCQSQRLF